MFKNFLIIFCVACFTYRLCKFIYFEFKACEWTKKLNATIEHLSAVKIEFGLLQKCKFGYLEARHKQFNEGIWCIIFAIAIVLNCIL